MDSTTIPQAGETAEYLAAVFGTTTGRAHISVGTGQRWEGGRFKHRHWDQTSYAWPSEADALERAIAQETAVGADVYLGPYLTHGEKRAKGAAVERAKIHADIDGTVPLALVEALGGYAVASGTAGHGHVYVDLAEPVPAHWHETLCRALGTHLGDADAKVSDNDVLRPPGTLNHKSDPPAPVEWLRRPTGRRWEPQELARTLGVTLPARDAANGSTAPQAVEAVDLPQRVRNALANVTDDRSADTMRVVGACHDAGLTLAQARYAVSTRTDLAGRLAERRHDDDVLACWLKATDSRARVVEKTTSIEPGAVLSSVLDVVTASDVEIRRVVYLWDQRIPLGAATLMPGEEGIGKTTVGGRIMTDLTRGTLPGEYHGTPKDVVVIATEDGLEDVFVPRLREAGADLNRVHIIKAAITLDGSDRQVIIPRDLAAISLAVRQWDAALVWIDSLVTTLPDEMKSISYKDTAKVLKALGSWAEQQRVAVVAPWHLNKASGSDTAIRIMDSRAFRTAVRSMLLVVSDPDAPEGETIGIVALDKANAGTLNVPALRYRIRSAHYIVPEADQDTGEVFSMPASCGVADWLGEVEGDGRKIARSALTPTIEKEDSPAAWLRQYLTNEGESLRTDVLKAAQEAGLSVASIKRAAGRVGVHSRDEAGRENDRPYRRSLWSLPSELKSAHDTHPTEPTGPTRETSLDPTELFTQVSPSRSSGLSGLMDDPTWLQSDPTWKSEESPTICAGCGGPIHWQRVAYGKDLCVDCETAS